MIMMSVIGSATFMILTHPMSMGMILLIQTIMVSLTTGFFSSNYWYSYILFLIMIGGMLVLFMYMTSIASNEKFMFSIKITVMVMTLMFTLGIIMLYMDPYIININNLYMETSASNFHYQMTFSKYLNNPSYMIMGMLIMYLLLTLIAVVKITNINSGPLRQS